MLFHEYWAKACPDANAVETATAMASIHGFFMHKPFCASTVMNQTEITLTRLKLAAYQWVVNEPGNNFKNGKNPLHFFAKKRLFTNPLILGFGLMDPDGPRN